MSGNQFDGGDTQDFADERDLSSEGVAEVPPKVDEIETLETSHDGGAKPKSLIDRDKAKATLTARLAAVRAWMPAKWFRQVERTPARQLGRRLRAHLRIASKGDAIAAKCEECVGYEAIDYQVGGCRSFACPLWRYRPYQGAAAAAREPYDGYEALVEQMSGKPIVKAHELEAKIKASEAVLG